MAKLNKVHSVYKFDRHEVINQIEYLRHKSKSIDDIFIVVQKSKVLLATTDAIEALSTLTKKKFSELADSTLEGYLSYMLGFVKPTNKYLTYNNKTIYKYNRTLELGRKPDIKNINRISKDKKVQLLIRERKLKRVLKDDV